MKKSERNYQLVHQIVSLTGINFTTRSVIGYVELTLIPNRDGLRHVRLNAKQCRIYKVAINDDVEASFQYFDPTLEVCQGDSPQRDLDAYSEAHLAGCNLVEADLNGGELNIKLPAEAAARGYVAEGKPLRVQVEFSLEEPQGGLHFAVPSGAGSLADRAAHMFSAGFENSSRLWFPCIDTLNELCTWKLEFTVDESLTAVSCGELIETVFTPDMKRKTFHYNVTVPTSAPNIGLAVGPFEIYVDPDMHEMTHFCLPHLLPVLKATARWLHEAVEFFEMSLATRFPFSGYKQVFIDEAYQDVANYSTMAILSTTLLHSSAVIDQVYETRRLTAEAVAAQFFGCYIVTDKCGDLWLKKGIAKYLSGLFVKKTFGNNEYRHMIHAQMARVVQYEEQYGGVILDSSQPPTNIVPMRGEDREMANRVQENPFAFPTSNVHTSSPEYMEVMALKAHLIVRMLEKRIGVEQLLQVFNKQLALANNAAQNKIYQQWSNMIISTLSFTKSIFTVTGKDMGIFMDQWVRMGGHARFHMTFVFNRKRNTVEM